MSQYELGNNSNVFQRSSGAQKKNPTKLIHNVEMGFAVKVVNGQEGVDNFYGEIFEMP